MPGLKSDWMTEGYSMGLHKVGNSHFFFSYLKSMVSIFNVAYLFVWIHNCLVFHDDNWVILCKVHWSKWMDMRRRACQLGQLIRRGLFFLPSSFLFIPKTGKIPLGEWRPQREHYRYSRDEKRFVNEHLKHENTLVFKANEYKVPVGDEIWQLGLFIRLAQGFWVNLWLMKSRTERTRACQNLLKIPGFAISNQMQTFPSLRLKRLFTEK